MCSERCASGFYRRTAGYIDAIGIADDDVNRARSYGGRALAAAQTGRPCQVAAAHRGSCRISTSARATPLTPTPATLRSITADPLPMPGPRREVRYQLFPDRNEVSYRRTPARSTMTLGFASFTSVTSYSRQVATDRSDVSYNDLGGITLAQIFPSAIYDVPADAYGIFSPQ